MKTQINEIKRMQQLAGLNEGNNDIIEVLLQWINKVDVDKYKSPYDFKEAVKQKILSLKDK